MISQMLYESIITAILTVVIGGLTFGFGQFVLSVFIGPIRNQDEIIEKISEKLVLYANLYANPKEDYLELREDATKTFRQLSSSLSARTQSIRWYKFFSFIKLVPTIDEIRTASRELILLSNNMTGSLGESLVSAAKRNIEARERIEQSLHFNYREEPIFAKESE